MIMSSGYYEFVEGIRVGMAFGDYESARELCGDNADIRYVGALKS